MLTTSEYRFDTRLHDRRIDMTLSGFWTPKFASEFAAELDRNVALMERAERPARSLIDVTDLSLLSVSITPVFRHFTLHQAQICDRVAVVVKTALGQMQAKRLMQGRDNFRAFTDREEALAWLLAGDADPVS